MSSPTLFLPQCRHYITDMQASFNLNGFINQAWMPPRKWDRWRKKRDSERQTPPSPAKDPPRPAARIMSQRHVTTVQAFQLIPCCLFFCVCGRHLPHAIIRAAGGGAKGVWGKIVVVVVGRGSQNPMGKGHVACVDFVLLSFLHHCPSWASHGAWHPCGRICK